MTDNEYLQKTLDSQTLQEEGDEMKALRQHRDDVETLLRKKFAAPIIRYGGSKAKGTMIRESYDLDVICYFDNDDASAGETLKEIYGSVKGALKDDYFIEEKPSALRLKGCDDTNPDFHIDVVPGRFTDGDRDDAFLYRSSGEKGRQKTNLQKHIDHISDSGVRDAIRLMKLWRSRNALSVRIFILELLTVELLQGRASESLTAQLVHVWTELRDHIAAIAIEDPANPTGNDLSELLDDAIKEELRTVASDTLADIESSGWEAVFGALEQSTEAQKRDVLRQAPSIVVAAPKPWVSLEDD
ncbi:MAG: hypothetical protein WBX15_18205 [Thermoanaerobaculia bacterium]